MQVTTLVPAMKNLSIIIQARTGSTRLPRKVLLPFDEGKTILEIIIDRLRTHSQIPAIIVATTANDADDAVVDLARILQVSCFRGSEQDVLSRFIEAAEAFGCENIVRVCGDNPLLNSEAMNELTKSANTSECDYIGFKVNGKPSVRTHFGFWAEYVTLGALKEVAVSTADMLHREHVTNYIYENPDLFRIKWINAPASVCGREDIRLTVDTEVDFANAKSVFHEVYKKSTNPTIDEVVDYLDKHPRFLDSMQSQIKSNLK